MKISYLLGIGLAAGLFAAACDGGSTNQLSKDKDRPGKSTTTADDDDDDDDSTGGTNDTTPPNGNPDPPGTDGPVPTNSEEGKAFFKANVHPALNTKCTSCHQTAGPGPAILNTDAETSYKMLFNSGYVVQQSRMVLKPAHGGLTNNVLSADEQTKYNDWVAIELKGGGAKAQPNILATIGQCFDRQKFDAMQLQNWVTTRRQNGNNQSGLPNGEWAENQNNCTGCDNAPCRACHSADPATNYVNANGNPIVPNSATYTFEESKLTNPNYIRQYFGTSPDGKAVASDGIIKKSEATKKDRKYTHPMYNLNNNQKAALEAFVNDAVTRYNAGQCGQAPPTQ
ncbi:MAG: hypothetical protein KIT84_29300 [Labilithrix sp.]|nr:hypothetical protein [Labilithrix sp.]MCW5815159.1 hypothetical protein [Labilithrix sp.]